MSTLGTRRWFLQQLTTDKLIAVDISENCMVGRNGDAKVCLKSNKVSRTHASLVNIDGNLLIQDFKSVNGTFVNGNQITVYILHPVSPGDVISFGIADINNAENYRDKECFFKGLVTESPAKHLSMEGTVADLTTEMHENAASSSANNLSGSSTNELNRNEAVDISSSPRGNEANALTEIEIPNTCSLSESKSSSKATRKSIRNNSRSVKPALLSCSLEVAKETKKSNSSCRRQTVQVEEREEPARADSKSKQPIAIINCRRKSTSSESRETEPNKMADFGELKLHSGDINHQADDKETNSKNSVATKRKASLNRTDKNKGDKLSKAKGTLLLEVPSCSNINKVVNDSGIKINEVKPVEEKELLNSKQIEQLQKIDAKQVDKNFTIDKDNSVIIDITDDNEDDMDFSCSQIFHMSRVVKTEQPDVLYQKIKNELAEMDFCNEEVILNPIPIDLEDDFYTTGFENTQDICAFLQDGIENGNKNAAPNPADDSVIDNEMELSTTSVSHIQQESDPSNKTDSISKSNTLKEQPLRVQIIEPPAIEKLTKKQNQFAKKKTNDKLDKGPTCKRRSSLEAPIDRKKVKTNSKNVPVRHQKYDSKIIDLEFKKRRSVSVDIDKAEKLDIREERRKKLKELASPNTSIKIEETCLESSIAEAPGHVEDGKKISPKLGRNAGKLPDFCTKEKAVANKAPEALKPVDLPPSLHGYNLRRAKSSDDIKVRKLNAANVAHENGLLTRHSTSSDVRDTPGPSATDFRAPVIPTMRVDPRRVQPIHKPSSRAPRPGHVPPPERRLIWNNNVQTRKPVARRLVNVDDITKRVVQWLPNWLEEQIYIDCSPPVSSAANKIPPKFRDFNQYYDTFSKLVLLENWQYVFKGFQEASDQPRKVKVEHVRITNDLMTLDCECYITHQELRQGLFYKPEDVVLFECVINDRNRSNCYMSLNFGLIQHCRKRIIPNNELISVRLGNLCPGDPHMKLEFTLLTRYQAEREINTRKMPIIKFLTNIRGHLMLIRAIKGLEESPLCSMILNPEIDDYKVPVSHPEITHPYDLNTQQKNIVLEAASLCTGDKHGIYCVKGPPGTGKSTVIVNLIFQILFSHKFGRTTGKPPMILLAAPSNTAVDSLISKLVAIKHSLRPDLRYLIKLIRIGPESSINKEVIGYSLPKLAENHVSLKNMDLPEFKAARERNDNLVDFAKAFFGNQYCHEIKACENIIINKSNIICTTLNSCINGRLMEAVNRGLIEFTCCIIDEATQCHEAEALLPTILGINKFVLVGDPKQLNATVMSRDALKLGFGKSLFSRLADNFRNAPSSPIKMLTDQYRMHPEICAFPNNQFYEGQLKSFPKPANKLPDEIRPYLVFNCEKVTPSKDYTNMDEIYLIKKLLSTILNMVNRNNKYTVGIITPYNAQKELICNNIADVTTENENCRITTNTVDSFQGSEFDIVIISCVRDSSNSFLQNENRLNVALTRAKQALYIIGNYTLFKECRPLYDLREDAKRRKVLLDIKQNPRFIGNINRYLIKQR